MSSYMIQVWQHPAQLPQPKSFEDVQGSLEQMRQVELTEPEPRFEALAKAMLKTWPSSDMFSEDDPDRNDAIWLNSPLKEVRELVRSGVWDFEMPREETEAVMLKLLEEAKPLGLTLLNEEMEMAWLPSGQILPPERAGDWNKYVEIVKAEPPKRSKTQVKTIVRKMLTTMLGKYGFEASRGPNYYQGSDFYFRRQVEVGEQVVFGSVRTHRDEYKLGLACRGAEKRSQEIFAAVFGARAHEEGGEYFFGAYKELGCKTSIHGNPPLGTDAEIQQAIDALEEGAICALQIARDLPGLNRMLNDENVLPERKTDISGYVMSRNFLPLMIAWLARNPRFDELVDLCFNFIFGLNKFR